MKILAASLVVTLALVGTVCAHNATSNDSSSLFIGQDAATGDEVMSIGPDPQTEDSSVSEPLIITPEIILPPQKHHGHGYTNQENRIRKRATAPQKP